MSAAPVVTDLVLQFRDVVKQFGGTLAVDHVSMELRRGVILALLGENGAGKSTLIKLLAGVHSLDSGEIVFGDQSDRVAPRVAFIHQDLGLIDSMTAAENIALANGYPKRAGRSLISWRQVAAVAADALEFVGGSIKPTALVKDLTRTEKALLAIARALATDADVVVLDEPTASLPSADVSRLFEALRRLKSRGTAMIYVTHRLDEVFEISDEIAVMRDGKLVGAKTTKNTNQAELVQLIVGRKPVDFSVTVRDANAPVSLRLDRVVVGDVGPIDLTVAAGEIIGIAGLRGAGHEAIGRALCGMADISGGGISLHGKQLELNGPADSVAAGIAFVTSNRQEESLAMTMSVAENLYLNPGLHGHHPLRLTRKSSERARARELIQKFAVRPGETERPVATLSGGNQQKVVLARWFATDADLFVLEEPTMGVDVGAKAEIYALMDAALQRGVSVIVVSTDFEEVSKICHRAFVFNRGQVAGQLRRGSITTPRLIELAAGEPSPV
jgi:ribose transport system ATP-binding protein